MQHWPVFGKLSQSIKIYCVVFVVDDARFGDKSEKKTNKNNKNLKKTMFYRL